MISRSQIQFVRSLRQKKHRLQHGRFLVEGRKLVQELLMSDFETEQIFAVSEWQIPGGVSKISGEQISRVSVKELNRMSGLVTPDQVMSVVKIPDWEMPPIDRLSGLTLMLDGLNDPGNLGTMIRIADWFGIETLICSPNCVDAYNPKVVQASMGSLFRVRVVYHDLETILNDPARKISAFGACMEGKNLYNQDLPEEALMVVGSESHGISPAVQSLLEVRFTIPSQGGSAESLNAAVAAGIICSEFRRNKLKNP